MPLGASSDLPPRQLRVLPAAPSVSRDSPFGHAQLAQSRFTPDVPRRHLGGQSLHTGTVSPHPPKPGWRSDGPSPPWPNPGGIAGVGVASPTGSARKSSFTELSSAWLPLSDPCQSSKSFRRSGGPSSGGNASWQSCSTCSSAARTSASVLHSRTPGEPPADLAHVHSGAACGRPSATPFARPSIPPPCTLASPC